MKKLHSSFIWQLVLGKYGGIRDHLKMIDSKKEKKQLCTSILDNNEYTTTIWISFRLMYLLCLKIKCNSEATT